MDQLTIVVPVHRPDHGRLQRLLIPSLANLSGQVEVMVVATDREAPPLAEVVASHPIQVLYPHDLVPELRALTSVRRKATLLAVDRLFALLRKVGIRVRYTPAYATRGWFQQQVLKLAVAEVVNTPYYLAVDADMICVRPTSVEELLTDNRAPISFFGRIPPEQVPWYRWAAELLGHPSPAVAMAMPPFMFATQVVRDMVREIPASAPARWLARASDRLVYGRPKSPAGRLLSLLPWTEFALFHSYLVAKQLQDLHYRESGAPLLLGNALWNADQAAGWSAEPSLDQRETHVFTLVQPGVGRSIDSLERDFHRVLTPGSSRSL